MGVFYLALKNLRIKRTKKCNYTSLCRFFVFVFLILAPAKSIGQDIILIEANPTAKQNIGGKHTDNVSGRNKEQGKRKENTTINHQYNSGSINHSSKHKQVTIPVSLSLACNVDGVRKYYSVKEWGNLSVDERIKCEKLGLLVKSTNETFLFSLYPLPKWSDWKTARARSGNQMPTQKQWLIIKQNRSKTQNALDAFGGGNIDNRRYWNSGDTPTWTTFFYDGSEYDKISPSKGEAGVWLATNDVELGFKEIEITKPINEEYDFIGESSNTGIRVVRYSMKYGFINNKGDVIVPLKYDEVGCGYDWLYHKAGNDKTQWHYPILMSVSQNGKWGFVNKRGTLVTPLVFDKVDDTSSNDNSPTWVSKEGRYGCVDTLGNYVMPLLYESEINFYNHQPAKVKKSGKWGFLNETGHVIIPFNYTSTRGFGWNESLAPVSIGNKYGYINKKGEIEIPIKYDFADEFHNGLAAVALDGKLGFIDKTGSLIISNKYDPEYSSDDDGRRFGIGMHFLGSVALVKKNGLYGIIDKAGKNLTPFKYERVVERGQDKFIVEVGNQKIFLDGGGNEYTSFREREEKSDSIMAYQGFPLAQYKMGYRFFHAKEYDKAFPWIKKSAEGGDYRGQRLLGYYYYYGYKPITQSYADAYKWFKLSAEQDDDDASYYLGWMYEHGQGVPADKLKAIEWYKKSNGQKDSRERIEALTVK